MENKVSTETMKRLPKIAAVDFDGTLKEGGFDLEPGAGWVNHKLFKRLKKYQKQGWKLILWTCRSNDSNGNYLDEAVEFCKDMGIVFDAVNENVREVQEMFNNDTRKVYADIYIDDKARLPKLPKKEKKS